MFAGSDETPSQQLKVQDPAWKKRGSMLLATQDDGRSTSSLSDEGDQVGSNASILPPPPPAKIAIFFFLGGGGGLASKVFSYYYSCILAPFGGTLKCSFLPIWSKEAILDHSTDFAIFFIFQDYAC